MVRRAVFLGHNDPDLPEVHHESDDELRLLALQHRAQRLYATGRQCAVDADVRDGEARAWRLRTTCFPSADVNMVAAGDPADTPGLVLDMAQLGSQDLGGDDLVQALIARWSTAIATGSTGRQPRVDADAEVARYADVARPALERARHVADRLERAIELARASIRKPAKHSASPIRRWLSQRIRSELVRRRSFGTRHRCQHPAR